MRPDLETTQRMYDLYCQGLTLQQVADLEGVSNQVVSKRFKRQGLQTRGHRADMGPMWETRFWLNVDKNGPIHPRLGTRCWLWTTYKDSNGYGWTGVGGKRQGAHRVSYQLATGEELGGLQIDHKCHNPSCVNPSHLRPATQKQNTENRQGAQLNSTTGVRGVYPSFGGRFMARVQHHGEVFHLGIFGSVEEANAVVIAKRLELFTHNEIDRVKGVGNGHISVDIVD